MHLSQGIVNFIAGLLPLYVEEEVDGCWCARSLADGTLIVPVRESGEDDNGWVQVRWQGDGARTTMVQGVFMASVAIARYVELHHTATHNEQTQAAMEHLSDHFTVKTGESLVFESQDDSLLTVLTKAIEKVGAPVVVEVLKRQIGL